ncbi:hypothetical protein [Spiroplasma endosymbiont of Polydrusus pterygomalis]|uniref:hypothetical protein n=1 Tax=Spiroplasma endosymbiont of Polydrusus pterygomalis TaxID=3139327 RepID=UPI003CCB659C
MIKKLNQKNNNNESKQEFDETIKLEIKELLQILEKNESIINEYQKKIEELKNNKNNCDKENKGIEFYQNLINDKNNEIVKIKERINLLKNTKNCNDNENSNNCCKEIKEKLTQLIDMENDKNKKINEIYQWQKQEKEKEIWKEIDELAKTIDKLKIEKDNVIPEKIKEKILKFEDINNQIFDNNNQICLLEKELKQDPNNEKLKEKIKNLTKENDKLSYEKNNIINKNHENEKISSRLKEIEKKLTETINRKKELEQQIMKK